MQREKEKEILAYPLPYSLVVSSLLVHCLLDLGAEADNSKRKTDAYILS